MIKRTYMYSGILQYDETVKTFSGIISTKSFFSDILMVWNRIIDDVAKEGMVRKEGVHIKHLYRI